jgi:hypothetical protein
MRTLLARTADLLIHQNSRVGGKSVGLKKAGFPSVK